MQHNQLISGDRKQGVCFALVIRELDFKVILGEAFDDRADLAADKTMLGKVGGQRHDF
jgi:hypothetical protein